MTNRAQILREQGHTEGCVQNPTHKEMRYAKDYRSFPYGKAT